MRGDVVTIDDVRTLCQHGAFAQQHRQKRVLATETVRLPAWFDSERTLGGVQAIEGASGL
jgi:hypothetical protein